MLCVRARSDRELAGTVEERAVESGNESAMWPQHWRLTVLGGELDPLYDKERPFFVVEFVRRRKVRDLDPEEPLDVAPSEVEQAARREWLWVYGDPRAMCESIPALEERDLDATDVLLVSPPSLNRSDAWRCERLKAVFELDDDCGDESGWLYLVSSGAIYGNIDGPALYISVNHARYVLFRDPRTSSGPAHRYFPLPKYQSIEAVAHRNAHEEARLKGASAGSIERLA